MADAKHIVRLASPYDCLGCGICAAVCVKGCIRMKTGYLGHVFPSINKASCIGCGLCERSCPAFHPLSLQPIRAAYASWSKDTEEYRTSASGGIASELSKLIVQNSGVVYGCAMLPGMDVRHIRVDKEEDLVKLKSSKYVQSSIWESIPSLKKDIAEGRLVLFIGTPCQVAAVKSLFKEQPTSLYLVDLICHGVPSLKLLKYYVRKVIRGKSPTKVTFRDGSHLLFQAWDGERLLYEMPCYDSLYRSWYMDAFLKGFTYRDSCYHCPYASSKRVGDITIGDFWGLGDREPADEIPVHPFGCSVVLPVSEKGFRLLEKVQPSIECFPRSIQEAIDGNMQLQRPTRMNKRIRIYRKIQSFIFWPEAYRWLHLDKMLGKR